MTRAQLEHLIRAAADIADVDEIIVIGSQSILGQFPEAPAALTVSVEADLYPRSCPERADLIDGSIGEGSPFHAAYGYYAQGVDGSTATLPRGWEERLVEIRNENTRGVAGRCLEVHDLLISKYVAGREKDRRFTGAAARAGLASRAVLLERLSACDLSPEVRSAVTAAIGRDFPG